MEEVWPQRVRIQRIPLSPIDIEGLRGVQVEQVTPLGDGAQAARKWPVTIDVSVETLPDEAAPADGEHVLVVEVRDVDGSPAVDEAVAFMMIDSATRSEDPVHRTGNLDEEPIEAHDDAPTARQPMLPVPADYDDFTLWRTARTDTSGYAYVRLSPLEMERLVIEHGQSNGLPGIHLVNVFVKAGPLADADLPAGPPDGRSAFGQTQVHHVDRAVASASRWAEGLDPAAMFEGDRIHVLRLQISEPRSTELGR
jgi:hypothetical protein